MIAPGIRVVRGPDWIWQNQGESTHIPNVLPTRISTGTCSQLLSGRVASTVTAGRFRAAMKFKNEMEFSEEFSIKLGYD